MAAVQPPCPGCALADDHPRHQCMVGDAKVLYHLDCHAKLGCPICQHATAGTEDLRGPARAAQLQDDGEAIQSFIESLDERTHNQVFGQVS